jgi:hypothetical protein
MREWLERTTTSVDQGLGESIEREEKVLPTQQELG